jgi:hypothetical protein
MNTKPHESKRAKLLGMSITCGKCGHDADIEAWTHTPVAGELPPGTYQCPECRVAFQRRHGEPRVFPNGFIIPGPVSLVPTGARL